MSRRASYLGALGACLALMVVLIVGYHPGFAMGAAGGLSAPAAPRTSLEAAPIAKLLQAQFSWCGDTTQSTGFSIARSAAWTHAGKSRAVGDATLHYGPLHRRPPPSLS